MSFGMVEFLCHLSFVIYFLTLCVCLNQLQVAGDGDGDATMAAPPADPNEPLALGGMAMAGGDGLDPNADTPVFNPACHSYIVAFAKATWPNNTAIHANSRFRPSSFAGIKPTHVREHLCNAVYGKKAIGPNDRPIHWRSSAVEQAKKAISHCMVQSQPSWNPATNSGNPAKSKEVNNLIKRIEKDEVRCLGKFHASVLTCVCWHLLSSICWHSDLTCIFCMGKPSCAKRPMRLDECRCLQRIGKKQFTVGSKWVCPCMMGHQMHLICRADDTANFEASALTCVCWHLLSSAHWHSNICMLCYTDG